MKSLIRPIHLTFQAAKTIVNGYLSQTNLAISRRDYRTVKKCFGVCERLYQNGNGFVKMLIENVYIYSISLYMPREATSRKHIEALLPPQLRAIYRKQLYQHGC